MKFLKISSLFVFLIFLATACEKPIEPTDLKQETEDLISTGQEANKAEFLTAGEKECKPSYTNLRVLFIGNSITSNYTTDIPQMLEELAIHNGKSIGTIADASYSGSDLVISFSFQAARA
jgi:hypothetical protein